MLWTGKDIAQALGVSGPDFAVDGVHIDSRDVQENDLFIALPGTTSDGHDYIEKAIAQGATGIISQRPFPGPVLIVKNSLDALNELGLAGRARNKGKIFAVTGSVGKTSTKEALLHVLIRQGAAHASIGSYNNHTGVPLSLARMPQHTEFGIFEIGMNQPGEIAPLARLVQPHIAIITAIAPAHIGAFDHESDIADEKISVIKGLDAHGTLFLPADSPWHGRMYAHASAEGIRDIRSFGSQDADITLKSLTLNDDSSDVEADFMGKILSYRIGTPGAHMAMNSLCILGAVQASGADIMQAAGALASFTPPRGRGDRHVITLPQGGDILLIDDSYNANPVSMEAALKVLHNIKGRHVFVGGDMLELGESGPDIHKNMAQKAIDAGVEQVFTAGPLMAHLFDALPSSLQGVHQDSAENLVAHVIKALQPGDVVLVKGSKGSRIRKVADALRGDIHAL